VAAKLSDEIREEIELAELEVRAARLKAKYKMVRKAIRLIKLRWKKRAIAAAKNG
jgi:hypothetical protein